LWDTATGKQLRRLTPGRFTEKDSWVRLIFSRDGKRLAAIRTPGPDRVSLWDVETGKELSRFGPPEDPFPVLIRTAAFSAENKLLVTLDELACVRVWDAGSGRQRRSFEAPREGWSLLALSPNGRALALAGVRSDVLLMDLSTGQVSRRLRGHRGAIRDLAFSPDGRLLASASQDTTVLVWDLARKD
jgi:WD40 repeat protein